MTLSRKIGIDLGTSTVRIYVKGEGIVINEPSGVATLHHLIGHFVRAFSAAGKDVVDVRFIGQDLFAAFAHRREVIPQFFEELLLEITVPGAAASKLFAHFGDFIL